MSQETKGSHIHYLSLNTQGLRDKLKRGRLLQWMKHQHTHIAFLQETHFTKDIENTLLNEFENWDAFHSFGETNSKGCTILINKTLSCSIIDQCTDINGRYLLINIELFENNFTLLNIYSPNNKKARNLFYQEISETLLNKSQGVKIIGGDHNDTLTQYDRIYRCINDKPKTVPVTNLKSLIKSHNVIDIWRHLNKGKNQYTWKRKNGIEKSRIDFWLIEDSLLPLILSTDIRPALIQHTDHMAISLKLNVPCKRGKGFWKFNNNLLKDNEYIKHLTGIINSISNIEIANNSNNQTKWELCKIEIREFSIKYAIKN